MRHLAGVVLAIVLAAAIFFAASWGYLKLLAGPVRIGTSVDSLRTSPSLLTAGGGSLIHDRAVLAGFGALLAVGLVAGILIAVPRISPLASGLPGLVLLGLTGLYLSSVRHAVHYIPLKTRAYGTGFEAMLFDGVLAMAGLVMIVPLFVPSRWRRRRVTAAPSAPAAVHPDLESTQTMQGDSGLLSNWYRTQTRSQPQVDRDAPAQAPWGPAEYS